jgi:hypothetical protein
MMTATFFMTAPFLSFSKKAKRTVLCHIYRRTAQTVGIDTAGRFPCGDPRFRQSPAELLITIEYYMFRPGKSIIHSSQKRAKNPPGFVSNINNPSRRLCSIDENPRQTCACRGNGEESGKKRSE